MNPILYTAVETAFDSNGIGLLCDAAQCDILQDLNGQFELEMQYPVNGLHFEDIAINRILMAKVDPVSDLQPFRIYRITKPMNGVITVYARHIAYDLRGITVSPFSATNCAEALQSLKLGATTDCPFDFWTDKTTVATMKVKTPNSIWNLLGGSKGSVLDVFSGEYEFDRFAVKLHNRRGADRGVSIRYGKNLTSLMQDENCANVSTGVHPYWTDLEGSMVELPEKILHAEGSFARTKIKPLDLSLEFETQPTEEQLRARAKKYMKDNDIGIPAVSWKVEFVQLEQTDEYKGKALLDRVLLGDTVSVDFAEMGVSASARAVSMRYDSLRERYKSVTLGSVRANLADIIVQQGQTMQEKPSLSTVERISMLLTATIMGAKGGAVRLLDTDGDGMPDELYIADNKDPNKALKVWRFNYEGWAGSKTGYNGPFVLGATLEDGLLAEAVTAAKLVAGTIRSKDGKTFYLDLDNGILKMQAAELSISGKTVDEIALAEAKKLTQEDVLKMLTNDGATQGFYVVDGKLYINAELVNILNMVADHVLSEGTDSSMEIEGGKLILRENGKRCVEVYASDSPIIYMSDLDGSGNNAEMTAHHLKIGGTSVMPSVHIAADFFSYHEDLSDGGCIAAKKGSIGYLRTDSLAPTGNGNCAWEYIPSIGKYVLVKQ